MIAKDSSEARQIFNSMIDNQIFSLIYDPSTSSPPAPDVPTTWCRFNLDSPIAFSSPVDFIEYHYGRDEITVFPINSPLFLLYSPHPHY